MEDVFEIIFTSCFFITMILFFFPWYFKFSHQTKKLEAEGTFTFLKFLINNSYLMFLVWLPDLTSWVRSETADVVLGIITLNVTAAIAAFATFKADYSIRRIRARQGVVFTQLIFGDYHLLAFYLCTVIYTAGNVALYVIKLSKPKIITDNRVYFLSDCDHEKFLLE